MRLTRVTRLCRGRRKERTNLRESAIRRDNVPMKIRGVASTTFCQTRVAEEKHVEGLVGMFIFP